MTLNRHKLISFLCQLVFMWCSCTVLSAHTDSNGSDFWDTTTDASEHYTFGLKLNELRNARSHIERPSRHSVNQLKNQIKFILNFDLRAKNESIDKYISESFNIYNPDPVYVFVLPGANRTTAFRRSNFSDVSYPNTTSLQALQKFLNSAQFAHLFPSPDDRFSKQLALNERFFAKYQQFMESKSENDLHEAESLKIIQENVRTEKNFYKFMDKLNDEHSGEDGSVDDQSERTVLIKPRPKPTDYSTLIRNIHAKDHVGNFELNNDHIQTKVVWPSNENPSWDDFGLHGWVGKMNEQPENPHEYGNPLRVELPGTVLREENLFPNQFVPILANYDPLSLLTTSTTTSTTPKPKTLNQYQNWPHSTHQFSFVEHNNGHKKPSNVHRLQRPRPPPIVQSTKYTTQPPVQLFVPAPSYLPAKKPSHHSHRKPFKLEYHDDSWDIKFNISDELRELLKLEKIKLDNISQTISTKSKWVVTSSRSKHRDEDVFVARANNPFGHSTKWKLSIASQNDVSNDATGDDGRQKRDVIDLYSMVKCATGCDPLIFKGYGCYCGFLGNGKALDGIDRCCKMHDYCYHAANCPKFLEYFVPYMWKCYRGRPLCAIDHGEWGGPGSCAVTLCECDRALSNCLRRFYCPRKRAVCTSSPLRLLQNILMDI